MHRVSADQQRVRAIYGAGGQFKINEYEINQDSSDGGFDEEEPDLKSLLRPNRSMSFNNSNLNLLLLLSPDDSDCDT